MILSKHPIINAYYLNVVITWNRRLSKSFLNQWCESTVKHPMDSCWRPLILHQSRSSKTTYLLHFLHLKIRGKNHYIKEMDCSRHENCFHLKMVQKKYIIYFRHAHPTQIITHKIMFVMMKTIIVCYLLSSICFARARITWNRRTTTALKLCLLSPITT